MKNQKLNCLFWAVVFLALCAASGWFVHRRVPTPTAAFAGGAIGGVMLLILLAWLLAIPTRIAEWWRIVLARLGTEPRDGRRTAIIGTLRALGELHAPFSRERCVLYSYAVESNTHKAYEGFAMVPLFVEHGANRTRIFNRPDISGLPAIRVDDMSYARHFIESTKFVAAPSEELDVERADYRRDPRVTDLHTCRFTERRLAAETTVCVTGRYDAGRQAITGPITLRTGDGFGIAAAWRVVNACIGVAIFS
ncbi:MAG TPA: hypothetical protein VHK90_08170, partial [Thermoanaerobaculia bacterium]|nr:hypothetical protein [Thermoanaerobaculia bacterium]